jgi:hypothetical protein
MGLTRWTAAALASLALAACSSGGGRSSATSPATTGATNETSVSVSASASAGVVPCPTASTTPGASGGKDAAPPGDIPDNQAFVAYAPASAVYEIKVPEGWSRKETSTSVMFTDKFNAIQVELVPAPSAPTQASGQAEVQSLARTVPCFAAASVSTITRKAGPAVLIKYRAASQADAVTGKVVTDDVERHEFWHNGTEAIITLSAPAGSDNVDPWKIVTDAFKWR